jgi:hypothetical protein
MRVALRSVLLILACVPLALSLAGCGGVKKVKAHGKLLNKGQPLTPPSPLPPGDPGIRLTFYPTDAGQGTEPQQAPVAADGTFQLNGNDQKGVVPGKYRVAVATGAFGQPDKFGGKFGENNSPIYREVTGNTEEIVIDVDKP